jgi:glycine/D-amino acid oxidase-like deaminating enzyme
MMSAQERMDPALKGVVWVGTSKEARRDRPALDSDLDVDLAVVGGGFCGLSTALHAAAAGLSVAVIEAGIVGSGASGRNGGFVVPQFPGAITPSAVRARLGAKKGAALVELVAAGPDAVMAQIARYQIACDAQQNGWIQPAHSPKALAKVRQVYEEWRALGAPVEWLDAGGIAAALGASGYLGGWRRASGAQLNPYALCQGLARAAENHGARIFERSRATAVAPSRGSGGAARVAVTVNGRRLAARKLFFATNGYTDGLVADEDRSIVPVHLYHVATKPLPADQRRLVNPSQGCFTDLRKSGGFGRYDVEGRLISGGAVFGLGARQGYGEAHARARMAELFPALGDVEIETYWEGWCAVTESFLPRFQILAPNVYSVGGFSTRGVALAQNIGRVVAEFLAESRALDDVPLEIADGVHRIAWQRLKTAAARVIFPVYQGMDRIGLS